MADETFDPHQDLDEDLLEWMSFTDMRDAAETAFAEFHARHVKYLYVVCRNAFGDDLDPATLEELVQDTFWKAYQKAGTFKRSSAEPQAARRRIRGWLAKIAERLFLDEMRRRKKQVNFVTGKDAKTRGVEGQEWQPMPLTEEELLVRRAVEELLEPPEREVIREYARHYDPDRTTQRSPEGVIDELKSRLGTTEENIRQLRKRGLDKIRQAVSAGLANSAGKVGVNVQA